MRLVVKHGKDTNIDIGNSMFLNEGITVDVTTIISKTPTKTVCEVELHADFRSHDEIEQEEGEGGVDTITEVEEPEVEKGFIGKTVDYIQEKILKGDN